MQQLTEHLVVELSELPVLDKIGGTFQANALAGVGKGRTPVGLRLAKGALTTSNGGAPLEIQAWQRFVRLAQEQLRGGLAGLNSRQHHAAAGFVW